MEGVDGSPRSRSRRQSAIGAAGRPATNSGDSRSRPYWSTFGTSEDEREGQTDDCQAEGKHHRKSPRDHMQYAAGHKSKRFDCQARNMNGAVTSISSASVVSTK